MDDFLITLALAVSVMINVLLARRLTVKERENDKLFDDWVRLEHKDEIGDLREILRRPKESGIDDADPKAD